jgi:hypothetical protein
MLLIRLPRFPCMCRWSGYVAGWERKKGSVLLIYLPLAPFLLPNDQLATPNIFVASLGR